MNREQKEIAVQEIASELRASSAVFAVNYRGITVPQVAALRNKLRADQTTFSVVKNRLTLRAADEVGMEGLKDALVGPTALVFIKGDVAATAKALTEFASEYQLLDYKGGLMEGSIIAPDQFQAIAKLPSRQVLYGQLAGMVAAPITGVVRTLNGFVSGLASQLQQIHDQDLLGDKEEKTN